MKFCGRIKVTIGTEPKKNTIKCTKGATEVWKNPGSHQRMAQSYNGNNSYTEHGKEAKMRRNHEEKEN